MGLLEKFDLKNPELSSLTCKVALEIDGYLTENEELLSLMDNPSQRLTKIIKGKLIKLEKLSSDKDLSFEYDTFRCLTSALYSHEDNYKEKYNPYQINDDFRDFLLPLSKITPEIILRNKKRTWKGLRDAIVSTYLKISENLESFRELPRERQEVLRDFSVTLSKELSKYSFEYFKRLAA